MTSVSSLMLTTRPIKPPIVEIIANRNGVAHLALLLVALALRTDQYEIENDDQYDQRKKLCQERTVVACCGHFIQCHEHCNYTSLCNVI